jgi:xanthine dehydrogenase accessory factor
MIADARVDSEMSRAVEFWRTLAGCLEAGEKVFLALVAANTRHSPGTAGARMLASESGRRAGTVGGGIMEHKLLARAAEVLRGGDFTPQIQTLHHRRSAAGERSGMICAGSQTNLYALCRPESELETVRRVASLIEVGGSGMLAIDPRGLTVEDAEPDLSRPRISLERDRDGGWRYLEQLLERRRLAILGGGHCAAALAHAMSRLGYEVSVFETRPDVAGAELARDARVRVIDDFRQAGALIDYPELTWVVVMTTDFPSDVKALAGVLDRPFPFVGVMGAPAKLEEIRTRLATEGFSPAAIGRIQAPVGLAIPSHTPEEIAISVAAQILELRAEDADP